MVGSSWTSADHLSLPPSPSQRAFLSSPGQHSLPFNPWSLLTISAGSPSIIRRWSSPPGTQLKTPQLSGRSSCSSCRSASSSLEAGSGRPATPSLLWLPGWMLLGQVNFGVVELQPSALGFSCSRRKGCSGSSLRGASSHPSALDLSPFVDLLSSS